MFQGTNNSFTWNLGTGDQLLADSNWDYVYDGSPVPLLQIGTDSSAPTDLLVQDQNLNTRAIVQLVGGTTSYNGSMVNYSDFDAYGTPQTQNGGVTNPGGLTTISGGYGYSVTAFGFGAGTLDSSNLVYLINRYYDPNIAQFASVDSMVNETGSPYSYAADQPVSNTDPMGLYITKCPGKARCQAVEDTGYTISKKFFNWTKGIEYPCSRTGNWCKESGTNCQIGYGHLANPNSQCNSKSFISGGRRWSVPMSGQAQLALLNADTNRYGKWAMRQLNPEQLFNQNERDAMVAFAYNLPQDWKSTHDFFDYVNDGGKTPKRIEDILQEYTWPAKDHKGLQKRQYDVAEMFNFALYNYKPYPGH